MTINVRRKYFTDESTISEWYIGDEFICWGLEDKDRGLKASDRLVEIQKHKIYGKTAIPYGTYEVTMSFSNRFKKVLPLLREVKGFTGIRIHPGNKAADTEGCLLPGMKYSTNAVWSSKTAFAIVLKRIKAAMRSEKVFITIERDAEL